MYEGWSVSFIFDLFCWEFHKFKWMNSPKPQLLVYTQFAAYAEQNGKD